MKKRFFLYIFKSLFLFDRFARADDGRTDTAVRTSALLLKKELPGQKKRGGNYADPCTGIQHHIGESHVL